MFNAAADPAPSDVVLASVRQPGDAACSNIHIRDGRIVAISAAGPARNGTWFIWRGATSFRVSGTSMCT
ncbi:hypothetical protein AHiyo6_22290 [Arthrobacter sp. Hiyo6]|nr:hypothetical protein AHiyo6_22290 [Arthrobacter sp. Hiyo6]